MMLDKYQQIQRQFIDRGLTLVGHGSGRTVYLSQSGRFVYKVPVGNHGLIANQREHEIYRHPEKAPHFLPRERVARCRLAPSGVLVMELVRTRPWNDFLAIPEWAAYVDNYQVGTNRENRIVAYDYGCE